MVSENTQEYIPETSDTIDEKMPIKKTIHWSVYLLAIWIAGIVFISIWLTYHYVIMCGKISRSRVSVSANVLRNVKVCLDELEISRRITICMQSEYEVPAITGVFKPRLILPSSLSAADDQTIQNICIHELTHFKYGDLYTITFLNLISIIYWFNPLVWKTVALIRDDMESLCDSRVTQRLGEKENYITTVLQFASYRSENRMKAALTMSAGGKLSMEERIKNLFRTKKTEKKTKITVSILAVMMIATAVLTACKPMANSSKLGAKSLADWTSSIKKAINDKNDVPIKKAINAPDKVENVTKKDKANININAPVLVPELSEAPAAKVNSGVYSQEEVDKIVKVFLGDAQLYEPTQMTKAALEKKLKFHEEELEDMKKKNEHKEEIESQEITIKMTKEELAEAKDSYPQVKHDGKLRKNENDSSGKTMDLDVVADTNKGKNSLYITSNGEYGSSVQVNNRKDVDANNYTLDINISDKPFPQQPLNIKMSKEQAIAEAEKIMKQIDPNFNVDFVGVGSLGNISEFANSKQAWAVVLTRSINKFPTTYEVTPNGKVADNPITETLYETATLYFDDNGLANVDWLGKTDVEAIENNNVKLLDFSEIEAKAKENIAEVYKKTYGEMAFDKDTEYVDFNVDEIKLGMMRVTTSEGKFMMVPVWDFFGTQNSKESKESFDEMIKRTGADPNTVKTPDKLYGQRSALITINAIDGSIIDRGNGY